jgi:murein DD-endopeptidase MepM/ murein hydrolase activator NlpD
MTLFLLVGMALYGDNVVKGTTKVMEFVHLPQDATLKFGKKTIPLLRHPNHASQYIAFIPVNYRSKTGLKKVTLNYKNGSDSFDINITDGNYPFETITVAPSKVKPNKKQRERTSREYHEAMKVYGTFTKKRFWNQPFIAPMSSHITSHFGTARMFNNTLKSYHSGTDYRAPIGTPIHATNDGVVVIAKNRYYAGNSVVIDHGEGIYSCYYHLSKINVKVGEQVKQNDILGLSGKTGRVSGPHLHYAMMVNGIQVDPIVFHQQVNALFE